MIRVRDLEKCYAPARPVLKGLRFAIEAGEVFGIVGRSGAGKSTLLRCFNGLETYQGGSVEVMGRQVKDLDSAGLKALRQDMGMIFQHFSLMSRKNVYENVAFPLHIWHTPKDRAHGRVMELLELVGLTEKKEERIQNLSGGQKQRVGIARALALNPKVLLCDEATSALDPDTTVTILDLLLDINRRLGITIVVVTHQMEVVRRICGRVLLLDGGRNVALGGVEDLFLAPPLGLEKFVEQEFTFVPGGTNIRLMFPRSISQQAVITTMARDLGVGFSIVGGRLDRYRDDVLGFLIINVADQDLDAVLGYMREKHLHWKVLP
ncbi:MAG: methionine ABC transporter ATP-binding protein [Desulfovibrio sp.]|jgi:D-methionine transport system ATP-binding protein|nr:methionine ABC transporter ATP-binding protein [Desulfovibrio sp.]